MKDINMFVLIGRLTSSPAIKMTTTGGYICNFTLAVNTGFNEETNEQKVHFIPITTFDHTAKYLADKCKKGNRIAVRGVIGIKSYPDINGKTISKIQLKVYEFNLFDKNENKTQFIDTTNENITIYEDDKLPF